MKKLILFLVCLILSSSKILSQSSIVNSQQSNQAMLFSLIGLSDFKAGSFGGGLGYQYYIDDNIALRGGFGLNSFSQLTYPDKPNNEATAIDSSMFYLEITPGIKYVFSTSTTIAAFIGCEVVFSYQEESSKNSNFNKNSPQITKTSLAFGGGIFLGIEWFAWENVSIGAEYKLRYLKRTGEFKSQSPDYEEQYKLPEFTNFGIGTGNYNFTLSFYF